MRMAHDPLHLLVRGLRRLNDGGGLSDAQLLERFLAGRDEAAFELLVWRHGPTVLGVCRRLLRHESDVEDAFQATFLALVRKAGSIANREALGSWLYKVAYRVALEARTSSPYRTPPEPLGSDPPDAAADDEVVWRDLRPVLDDAVMALPRKYREAFVLCCVEGKTNEEASQQLGCPKGTVDSRLNRARAQLRARLTRRGVFLSSAAAAALTGKALASAPGPLADKVVLALRGAEAGAVSTRVAALTQGALRAMFLSQLKTTLSAVVVAVVLLGSAAGLLVPMILAGDPAVPDVPAVARDEGQPGATAPAQEPRAGGEPQDKADDAAMVARLKALNQSQNNLKHIGLALHNHLDTYRNFPAPAIYDQNNKPLLSWRVALLPFLDAEALYRKFKLDEPWDSEHNLRVAADMPAVYAPVLPTKEKHVTYYQGFVGTGAFFEPQEKAPIHAIVDGTSNTLAVVEAGEPVFWTKPEDLPFVAGQAVPRLGGLFPGFFNALVADGSVVLLSADADGATLRKAIQRNDGQAFDFASLRAPRNARGPLDTTVLRLEQQQLQRSLSDARAQVAAAKRDLEALRTKVAKVAGAGDAKGGDLLGNNARLRAELTEEMSLLEALRAEAARLEAILKRAASEK
jgi:RNA polymerase sigma factor (sigma-70 family)